MFIYLKFVYAHARVCMSVFVCKFKYMLVLDNMCVCVFQRSCTYNKHFIGVCACACVCI